MFYSKLKHILNITIYETTQMDQIKRIKIEYFVWSIGGINEWVKSETKIEVYKKKIGYKKQSKSK